MWNFLDSLLVWPKLLVWPIVLGVIFVVVAIFGGGLNIRGFEVPKITLWPRLILGGLGSVVIAASIVVWVVLGTAKPIRNPTHSRRPRLLGRNR